MSTWLRRPTARVPGLRVSTGAGGRDHHPLRTNRTGSENGTRLPEKSSRLFSPGVTDTGAGGARRSCGRVSISLSGVYWGRTARFDVHILRVPSVWHEDAWTQCDSVPYDPRDGGTTWSARRSD